MRKFNKIVLNKILSVKESKKLSQNEIALNTGINQSTVSRILNGEILGQNSSIKKICKYLCIDLSKDVKVEASKSNILMDALNETWDGTEEHAQAISDVIRSLNSF